MAFYRPASWQKPLSLLLLCAALALLLPADAASALESGQDDAAQPRYDAFTVVDQAVTAARSVRGMAAQARRAMHEKGEGLPQNAAREREARAKTGVA